MSLASLVTLDELKTQLSIQNSNTSFDDSLKQLARVSTKALETFCRRVLTSAAYTEYFSTRYSKTFSYDLSGDYQNLDGLLEGANVQRFPLNGFPVDLNSAFSVYYDTTREFADDTLLDSTDYYINSAGNALYLLKGTIEAPRSLKVTYTGGYATSLSGSDLIISGAPEDLKMACITQVIFFFNKIQEGNIGVRGSKKHSPEYIQNAQMLCPEAQAFALPYRRRLLGKR